MRARNRKVEIWLGIALLIAVVAVLYLLQTGKVVPRGTDRPAEGVRGVRSVGPQTIESELLPLRLQVDRVSERISMAIGGGAIESTGSELLIMDRMGKIFVYGEKEIAATEYPALPMRYKEFSENVQIPVTEGTLRAHDLKYSKEENCLYVSYDSWDTEARAPRFVISRILLSRNSAHPIGDWEPVYTSAPVPRTGYYAGRSAGGKMLIVGHNLYFAVGDYSLDRVFSSADDIAAQNVNSPFGKIYRYHLIDKTLTMISIGHRVPQGLAVTAAGEILETEHGPRGGDELNMIVKGGNYGWPYVSYGTRYFSYRPYLDATTLTATTIDPVFAWVPSIAVSSLFESHHFAPEWMGDIVVGSLKAQSLFRIKYTRGHVVFSEPIWIGHRIRDVIEQDGRLVIWSDDGALIFVTPDRKLLAENRLNVEREYKFGALASCSACHSFADHNQFSWAPSLKGIFGAKIGGDGFQNYSQALRNKGGVWDDGSLTAFLLDPQRFVPGTTMINPDLTPAQIAEIVGQLKGSPQVN